jgi:heme/copper-type cytochrome/quinol oxidase subunit 2
MLYHTTTRNVGIYTSLSLVALGSARALLANKRDMVAAVFCMCSGLFLYLAMELNKRLLRPSTSAAAAPTSKRVPIVLAVVHILMIIMLIVATWRGITTFRRR